MFLIGRMPGSGKYEITDIKVGRSVLARGLWDPRIAIERRNGFCRTVRAQFAGRDDPLAAAPLSLAVLVGAHSLIRSVMLAARRHHFIAPRSPLL